MQSTFAKCTRVSIGVFIRAATSDVAFNMLESVAYYFNRKLRASTYLEVCFSSVFGSVQVVPSSPQEVMQAIRVEAGSSFTNVGIIHKTVPFETLFESNARLNCAGKRSTVIQSLLSNLYAFKIVSINLEYLYVRAAISPLYV